MKLPDRIVELIGNQSYTFNEVGMSDSQVICFEDCVLKIEKQREESDQEHQMMKWLQGRLPVPRVLCSMAEDGINYLLMSKMAGMMSCDAKLLEDPDQLVKLLADGLRMLWRVDPADCPCHNTLENKLRLAGHRVLRGLCDISDADPGTYGETGFEGPIQLLQWLKDNKPREELVFSHGDYCLPNVFIQNNRISGFIDLGRSGFADPYQDIALCYRSLKHNVSGTYGGKVYQNFRPEALFDELKLTPNWDKIRYYSLLDELF